MKKKYLFIPGAKKWNSLLRKFLNLHKRIKKGNTSEQQLIHMSGKLQNIYKRLEKMQYRIGIKIAGSALALMLISATSFSQDFTKLGNLTCSPLFSHPAPVFADIDGDDDLDLYVGAGDGCIRVLRNDGTETFSDAGNMQADGADINTGAYAIPEFADIDGDDDLDLYVGNWLGTIYVFVNDGTGTFSSAGYLQAGGANMDAGMRSNPVFEDFDKDGDLDLYIGEKEGAVKVFINDGAGNFSAAADLQANGTDINVGTYSDPAFADIDGDNDLDLYVSENSGTIKVFTNNGSGIFYANGNLQADGEDIDVSFKPKLIFEDLDGDGDLDLYVNDFSRHLQVFTNDGTGTFSRADHMHVEIDVGYDATPVFEDIDGDEDLDLYVGEYYGAVKVFLNSGGVFYEQNDLQADGADIDVSENPKPAFADIDKDGDLDLYIGEEYGAVKVFINDGTGIFNAAADLQAGGVDIAVGNTSTPTFADIDGDGDLDLYVGEKLGSIKIFTNDGAGNFSVAGNLQADGIDIDAGSYSRPVFANIDGDGDLDLYVGESYGRVKVFENDGTGTFSEAAYLQAGGTDIDVHYSAAPVFASHKGYKNLFVGNMDGFIIEYQGIDLIDPVVTSTHNNQTVDANSNCESSMPDYTGDVTATDNFDTDLDITQTPTAGTTISGTTNAVNIHVTDNAGNNVMIIFNVEVVDNTNPVITSIHNNQNVDAGEACEASLPDYTGYIVATDNCDDALDVVQSPVAGTTISGTTNSVTLIVTDDAGNTDEVSFNVEVVDNGDPFITSTHGNQYPAAGDNCNITLPDYKGGVEGWDDCDDALDITQSPVVGSTISGVTNTITLTATDDAGNTDEVTFNVEVVDNINPVVTCPDDLTVTVANGASYTVVGTIHDATATDNCSVATLLNNRNSGTSLDGEIFDVGIHTIQWAAIDNSGNTDDCSVDITVEEEDVTGLHNLKDFGINIYPNPTSDNIVIAFDNPSEIKRVILIDILGKQLYEVDLIEHQQRIDLSAYSEGLYILCIQTDDETLIRKVIKK